MHKDKEKVKTGHEEVEDVDEGFLNLMMKISQKNGRSTKDTGVLSIHTIVWM